MEEYLAKKRTIYCEYAKTYDEDRRLMVGEAGLSGRIEWALSGLLTGQRLLDLGCGTGNLLVKATTILGAGGIACGLDLSSDMLAIADEKIKGSSVRLMQANAIDPLPFASDYFDMVTSLNLLQELPPRYYQSVLREVHRVLKPRGWFRGVVPCIGGASDADYVFSLEAERQAYMFFRPWQEVEAVFRDSGFETAEITLRASSASQSAAKGEPRFKLFTQMLEIVRAQGMDPELVQEPVLLFSGRKS